MPSPLLPVAFISHGSPMLALDEGEWSRALGAWARSLPAVHAILVLSAHWETPDLAVTAAHHPGTLHDFGGFPEELYRLEYPAPGHPALAARVGALLGDQGIAVHLDPQRPRDHGAWVPLMKAFPGADLPVLQISLPAARTPRSLLDLGRVLAPLRGEGVLLMASGGVVHNLARLDWSGRPHSQPPPQPWASEFDAWIQAGVESMDPLRVLEARDQAPFYRDAVPTSEHFDPLYFALGAAGDSIPRLLFQGWQHGNLSLRAWTWQ